MKIKFLEKVFDNFRENTSSVAVTTHDTNDHVIEIEPTIVINTLPVQVTTTDIPENRTATGGTETNQTHDRFSPNVANNESDCKIIEKNISTCICGNVKTTSTTSTQTPKVVTLERKVQTKASCFRGDVHYYHRVKDGIIYK